MDNHQLRQTKKEDEYLNEEGIENLLENGNTGAHEGNVMNIESIIMPHLEMEFNTREGQEFFDLYLSIESSKQEEEPWILKNHNEL